MSEPEFANPDDRAANGAVARDVPRVVTSPDAPETPEASAPDARAAARAIGTPARGAARRSTTRGATGRGVIALILIVTAIGGLADMVISGHRGHLFGVTFAVACAIGALVVRRRDLATAVIAPPLLYCVLILLMSAVDQSGLTGGLFTREAFYLGNAFVTGTPSIWIGAALAAGIGWYRSRTAR